MNIRKAQARVRRHIAGPSFEKRGRGRPKGSKDSHPRQYRSRNFTFGNIRKSDIKEIQDGMLSVEEKLRQIPRPVRIGVLAEISGISATTIRKKIEQRKIPAFHQSGILLVQPQDFLEYWHRGTRV